MNVSGMSAKHVSAIAKYSFEGKIGFKTAESTSTDGKIGGKIGFSTSAPTPAKCADGKIGSHVDVNA